MTKAAKGNRLEGLIGIWKAKYKTKKMNIVNFDQDLSQNRNLIEYNLMCCEAMILMECILDAQAHLTLELTRPT